MNEQARAFSALGQYDRAQPLFEKSLSTFQRLLTDESVQTAHSYHWLGRNFDHQGKFADAERLHRTALVIIRRLLTDDHSDTALSYGYLAANLNAQRRFAEAEPLWRNALAIFRGLFTDDDPETAGGYNMLADNLFDQGKYVEALPFCENALRIRRHLLTDDHPGTGWNYNSLAGCFYALGRYVEARDRLLSAAKSLDTARLRIAFAGMRRPEYGRSPRGQLAAIHARLGQRSEAWQAFEEDRSQSLLDELAARQDYLLTAEEQDRIRELTAELARLDRILETELRGPDPVERAKRIEDLQHQREQANSALGGLQATLIRNHGVLGGQVAGLREIQAALPHDAALIAWVDFPQAGRNAADRDGEHWGVVVRARGVPSWIEIKGTDGEGLWSNDDTWLANSVRTELGKRLDCRLADLMPLLERLRTQRLEPLAGALGKTADGLPEARRLIVLPSRAMAGIPIDALLAKGDSRTVSYAPSATVLKSLRERPRPELGAGLLALGDPIYERSAAVPSGAKLFEPLPWARVEVAATAQIFRSCDWPVRILLGGEASKRELSRLGTLGEVARFRVIHIATHAVIDDRVLARSAVILTQMGSPDQGQQAQSNVQVVDGRLSISDIQHAAALNAELVTLSACETATGRDGGGEGFIGFAQAFLMSGARNVCLSLWKADDQATSLLMARFYQNALGKRPGLKISLSKPDALREAKQWLRGLTDEEIKLALKQIERGGDDLFKPIVAPPSAVHPYDHPYYWAGFLLVGDLY